MKKISTVMLIGLTSLLVLGFLGHAYGEETRKIDKKKIYFGDAENFAKPGMIRILDVFKKIPEFIAAQKKSQDDPEYYILLVKANEKFQTALKAVAKKKGYDLIGEIGAIRLPGKTVAIVTEDVIDALEETATSKSALES